MGSLQPSASVAGGGFKLIGEGFVAPPLGIPATSMWLECGRSENANMPAGFPRLVLGMNGERALRDASVTKEHSLTSNQRRECFALRAWPRPSVQQSSLLSTALAKEILSAPMAKNAAAARPFPRLSLSACPVPGWAVSPKLAARGGAEHR